MYRLARLILISAGVSMAQEGTRVYIAHCQQCHDQNSDAHAPLAEALATKPWEAILKSLETGAMRAQGAQLTPEERRAVARYLGKAGPSIVPSMTGYCPAGAKPKSGVSTWNGWSPDERNTRYQPADAAGLTAEQVPSLKLKWAFGFPDTITAYGQPTVVSGRVYTGSNDGTVYAIDAESGCLYWSYQAKAMVRDAVIVGPGPRAYFGDLESNFYALDADTGKLIWQKKLDDQAFTRITGTAKLYDGRLYVPISSQEENAGANPFYSCCTFRGNIVALNASDGSLLWKTYTVPEAKPTWKSAAGIQFYGPSGATIWSSPTLDLKRKLLYVATGNGYSDPDINTADAIIAMDMATGAIRWTRQASPDMFNWDCGGRGAQGPQKGNCPEKAGTDVDFGASPILVDLDDGRQMILAGQKSAVVWGFDPDQQGKTVWQTRIGKGGPGGGIQWGIAYSPADRLVFAPLADSVRGDPLAGGGLFALDAATGKLVWHTPPPKPSCAGRRGCSGAQRSPPTVIPGVVFSPSMDGHIRAYRIKNGEIVWDYDAVRDYTTVNGIPGRGGSFSATGPVVVDGLLYVNSGYSSMPGNVLLAFSVK
ncbi:MAG: PQQ-binding-like beta-propeller repeat protein [Bryobacteraceae bacterium]|jgi:polyvinyl alcohol dehydrogenase (cytochrome)